MFLKNTRAGFLKVHVIHMVIAVSKKAIIKEMTAESKSQHQFFFATITCD